MSIYDITFIDLNIDTFQQKNMHIFIAYYFYNMFH